MRFILGDLLLDILKRGQTNIHVGSAINVQTNIGSASVLTDNLHIYIYIYIIYIYR